jgi:hypothetical protein
MKKVNDRKRFAPPLLGSGSDPTGWAGENLKPITKKKSGKPVDQEGKLPAVKIFLKKNQN